MKNIIAMTSITDHARKAISQGGWDMTISSLREKTYLPDKTFPINVFYVGDIYLHWHDHMEWIYVKNGCARVQIDGSFERLTNGELALVNAKQLHGATIVEPDTELVAIVFSEALLRNSGLDSTEEHYFSPIFSHRLQLPNFLRVDNALTMDIRSSVGRLIEEFEGKLSGFELLIKAELFRIFGLLFRYCQQLSAKPAARTQPISDFSDLLQYLRVNYHREISIKDTAKRVNLSPSHFCKMFKRLTGKTLIEYIHLLRVNQAERLLVETDWPVTLVADRVGFGNLSYFGRKFKEYKHLSPSEFRARPAATVVQGG